MYQKEIDLLVHIIVLCVWRKEKFEKKHLQQFSVVRRKGKSESPTLPVLEALDFFQYKEPYKERRENSGFGTVFEIADFSSSIKL